MTDDQQDLHRTAAVETLLGIAPSLSRALPSAFNRALPAWPLPPPTSQDMEREAMIAEAAQMLQRTFAAGDTESARAWWDVLRVAVLRRTPTHVLRIELARGLR